MLMAGDEERLRRDRNMAHCILQPEAAARRKTKMDGRGRDYGGVNMMLRDARLTPPEIDSGRRRAIW